jgi:hypothetical protein
MTVVRCDCCDETFVDEVGALLIWEAVIAYRAGLADRAAREREAWREADVATENALRAARG